MEIKTLNCPNCGGPVKVPNTKNSFNCEHCGSALKVHEEAGVSLLEFADRIASLIEGGNQEIISVIQKTSRSAADHRLYQSQLEQELTNLNVQLVPLKAEIATLSVAKRDAAVTRRLKTVSIQIYMLLERIRLLHAKLNEISDPPKSQLDKLHEQNGYIKSELSYLAYAGNSPDVQQFKKNLTAQSNDLVKHMAEIINSSLESASFRSSLQNDMELLSNQLRIVQADIRKVSALPDTEAKQKVLVNLRTQEREINRLIFKIQADARQAEFQRQSAIRRAEFNRQTEIKLAGFYKTKNKILDERSLTLWEGIAFFIGEQSIRHLGLVISTTFLVFGLGMFFWFFLSVLLIAFVGIPIAFTASVIVVLIVFNIKKIRRFFAGKLGQWREQRRRNQILKESIPVSKAAPGQAREVIPAEQEETAESAVEVPGDIEVPGKIDSLPSQPAIEASQRLEEEPVKRVTFFEPDQEIMLIETISTPSENSNVLEANPAVEVTSVKAPGRAETAKPKFAPKKLALILATILTCGASGFCVLLGSFSMSESIFMGVSATLFGLFCLGLAGLAVANLRANPSLSKGQSSAQTILNTLYSHQKAIGLVMVAGLILTCIGTLATTPPSDSASAKPMPSKALNVSSLQTSAVETAMQGIYQTGTAGVPPTFTPTPVAEISPTSTTESVQGKIIQDLSNMRAAPSLDAPVVAKLGINTKISAVGSNPDKVWFLIVTENGNKGWIHNTLAQFSTSPAGLPISTESYPTPISTSKP